MLTSLFPFLYVTREFDSLFGSYTEDEPPRIGCCREVYFSSCGGGGGRGTRPGYRCREVAVVERFKQQSMYGLSVLTKKVAVVDIAVITV